MARQDRGEINITNLLFKDRPLAPLKEMDLARQVEAEMILLGYDGKKFIESVSKSAAERKKKGIADRRNRYIHYCYWAHSLKRHNIGPEGVQYSFPAIILNFIRSLCPTDIKGEIRADAYNVTLEEFCEAIL